MHAGYAARVVSSFFSLVAVRPSVRPSFPGSLPSSLPAPCLSLVRMCNCGIHPSYTSAQHTQDEIIRNLGDARDRLLMRFARDEVEQLFSGVTVDEDGGASFHELQKLILEVRHARVEACKVMYPGLTGNRQPGQKKKVRSLVGWLVGRLLANGVDWPLLTSLDAHCQDDDKSLHWLTQLVYALRCVVLRCVALLVMRGLAASRGEDENEGGEENGWAQDVRRVAKVQRQRVVRGGSEAAA